jgi:hypothetical protein
MLANFSEVCRAVSLPEGSVQEPQLSNIFINYLHDVIVTPIIFPLLMTSKFLELLVGPLTVFFYSEIFCTQIFFDKFYED